jgi:hypothetical protein
VTCHLRRVTGLFGKGTAFFRRGTALTAKKRGLLREVTCHLWQVTRLL